MTMKTDDLSLFDRVFAVMYGDIWRSSPIFGAPLHARPRQDTDLDRDEPADR